MDVTSLRPLQGLISLLPFHQHECAFALAASTQDCFSLAVLVVPNKDALRLT